MGESEGYDVSVLGEAGLDEESVTCVVVSGATRELVAGLLGVDLSSAEPPTDADEVDRAAYAIGEVPGGVLAIETTGYADPANEALRRLSSDGRSAAVVRSNVQAHVRFGCARDGRLLFDEDEYPFLEDVKRVPDELRALFDLAWDDLDSDDDDLGADPVAVGIAMAVVVTGVDLTAEDVQRVVESGFFRAPSLVYDPSAQ